MFNIWNREIHMEIIWTLEGSITFYKTKYEEQRKKYKYNKLSNNQNIYKFIKLLILWKIIQQ